ncbi:MAG: sulfatase-like hydrolase/transferase, partial [Phycisphaerales bacterium]|nr:sulfatase-like hydrolase/transferase [Phycisphaerales bacterium]
MTLTRRNFLQYVGIGAAAVAAPNLTFAKAKAGAPNLLIIQTDEHNFRTLGCYRDQLPKSEALMWGPDAICETPHIDSIAKEGLICNRFYASTPVCSPSRGSLVSGQYPQNSPVTNNNVHLGDDVITFAEILRREGYATGYSGKWHLAGNAKPGWAPKKKFGFTDNRLMYNRGHWKKLALTPQGPRVDTGSKNSYTCAGATKKNFTTDVLADWTIDFIRKHKNEPFCYMVAIPDPHGPNSVRAPYNTMYDKMKFTAPKTMSKKAAAAPDWAKPQDKTFSAGMMKSYFGMVKCIDDNVGRIIAELKKLGIYDNTIVIFTSDHGDLCHEHGKHNKGNPLEGSAKVAFVLRYPKTVKAGTVIDEALTCVDFLPTALGLMNVKTAGKEEGRDASKLFTTGKAPAGWEDYGFFRSTCKDSKTCPKWLAVATKKLKFVVGPQCEPWLIDLKKNPNELTNSFADPAYREELRAMGKALRAYCKAYGDCAIKNPAIKA